MQSVERQRGGERESERERNCVLVCAFQGGISSRKSKKAWLIWLGLLFLAYRDYVITWKIKNFEIQISQSPLTLVIRDSWCRSPYPINVWWWGGLHLIHGAQIDIHFLPVTFFFFLFRTNKKQIKSTFTLKLLTIFCKFGFQIQWRELFPTGITLKKKVTNGNFGAVISKILHGWKYLL